MGANVSPFIKVRVRVRMPNRHPAKSGRNWGRIKDPNAHKHSHLDKIKNLKKINSQV